MMKKAAAFLLCICMILSVCAVGASAAETTLSASGTAELLSQGGFSAEFRAVSGDVCGTEKGIPGGTENRL